jgi:peroxiredoxin family protein
MESPSDTPKSPEPRKERSAPLGFALGEASSSKMAVDRIKLKENVGLEEFFEAQQSGLELVRCQCSAMLFVPGID